MRFVFCFAFALSCGGDDGAIDATTDTIALDAFDATDSTDAPDETTLALRFGHFIPDLADPLHFCTSVDGVVAPSALAEPVEFRVLSDRTNVELPSDATLEVIASLTRDCAEPLGSVELAEPQPGGLTVAFAGLANTTQDLCGETYTAPCPSSIGVAGRYWSDAGESFAGTPVRFIDLAPNSFGALLCVDPDGDGPMSAVEVGRASAAISPTVELAPTETAHWFVIRFGFMLDRCDGDPDILATVELPTPSAIQSRSPRVATQLNAMDSVVFIGSGLVASPPRADELLYEFVPWQE